jgi:hypothetical protein
MNRRKNLIVGLACVGLLAVIAVPVYAAACKMCKTISEEIVVVMESKGVDLAAAVAAAEKRSGGKALIAEATVTDGKLSFGVHCWTGRKILLITIEENGKASNLDEPETLPNVHDPVAHKPKPSPAG